MSRAPVGECLLYSAIISATWRGVRYSARREASSRHYEATVCFDETLKLLRRVGAVAERLPVEQCVVISIPGNHYLCVLQMVVSGH